MTEIFRYSHSGTKAGGAATILNNDSHHTRWKRELWKYFQCAHMSKNVD